MPVKTNELVLAIKTNHRGHREDLNGEILAPEGSCQKPAR
jgi:hypothetical protein